MSSPQGRLVAIEGPSGAGKTTLAALAAEAVARERPAVLTRQPSDGPLGVLARQGTRLHRGAALACLVAADRYEHLASVIEPAIAAGVVVVCDRYVLSSYVLQRLDAVPRPFLADVNALARAPDLYVVLTAPPKVAAGRVRARGGTSRFHPLSDQQAATEAALYDEEAAALASSGQAILRVPSGHGRPEDLAATIAARILEL